MADIVLTTVVPGYIHTSFGLRCLHANLGTAQSRAAIVELMSPIRTSDAVEQILAHQPSIVGMGVYIWNAQQAAHIAAVLKTIRPDIALVLGGPEVWFELDRQPIAAYADYIVRGEAELAFRHLCERLLAGERPQERILEPAPPALEELALPYDLYSDDDIAHRLIYVEASRGCPFACEFCLSSMDSGVRNMPLAAFFDAMQKLWQRGVRHFKFADRSINVDVPRTQQVLDFFAPYAEKGAFLHLEMVPSHFPESLRQRLASFPEHALQLELGLQTLDATVAKRIGRRQDNAKIFENIRFLRDHTSAHLHTDLIIGLPGEGMESFGTGFNQLVRLDPHEVQVGVLKRLRGVPICRHCSAFDMAFDDQPPYEILQTSSIDFGTMQRLKRFAHLWGTTHNSGAFKATLPLCWQSATPFEGFLAFCDWVFDQQGQVHSLALNTRARLLFRFLVETRGLPTDTVMTALEDDFQRTGRRLPNVQPNSPGTKRPTRSANGQRTLRRQSQHRGC